MAEGLGIASLGSLLNRPQEILGLAFRVCPKPKPALGFGVWGSGFGSNRLQELGDLALRGVW